jgi:hypothetical protein
MWFLLLRSSTQVCSEKPGIVLTNAFANWQNITENYGKIAKQSYAVRFDYEKNMRENEISQLLWNFAPSGRFWWIENKSWVSSEVLAKSRENAAPNYLFYLQTMFLCYFHAADIIITSSSEIHYCCKGRHSEFHGPTQKLSPAIYEQIARFETSNGRPTRPFALWITQRSTVGRGFAPRFPGTHRPRTFCLTKWTVLASVYILMAGHWYKDACEFRSVHLTLVKALGFSQANK